MEPDNIQNFIAEAAIEIPSLRRGILTLAQPGSDASDISTLIEMASMICAGASGCGITDTEVKAAELGSALSAIAAENRPVAQSETASLLDRLAELEEALLQNYFGESGPSIDVAAFVDESFDSLQCVADGAFLEEQSADGSDELVGFDIDEELLEVFALEAEGLLKNIESSLDSMRRNPDDRDALWAIRRNAHTFKGAAGIVGFKKPSELAHRVEDLLDRMAENDFRSTVPLFDVLRNSTDCLQAMTSGDTSRQLQEKVANVYREFDRVLLALASPASVPPAETVEMVETLSPVPPILRDPDALLEIPSSGPEHGSHFRRRSIVRVPLERLDHLVRITRDLLIDRSIFEQRLRDLETQIDELTNATRRLQSTSGKLEIDFEASMLSSPTVGRRTAATDRRYAPVGTAAFDDLEFDRYTEFHQSTRQLSEAASDTVAIGNALDIVHGSFETLFEHQRFLIEEMQEKLMGIRMVEFSSLATRLQRVVSVTCEEAGKKVRLTIQNEKQELDTQILDGLAEPLMHLLKNAVVHGVETPDTRRMLGKSETGEITLNVTNEETHVVLTVKDDGRGIALAALKEKAVETGRINREQADAMSDNEACDLMFVSGLTTAEKLNLSAGRGVGMSIIKESLEAQRGQISIESFPQKGTLFTIRVPLKLAVTNALLVKCGRQTLAVPIKLITRVSELKETEVFEKDGIRCVNIGSSAVPLSPLSELIAAPSNIETNRSFFNALQIETGGKSYLVAIDEIVRTEEVVIKSLGRPLENISGILGAAILGNGELVPILDMPHLLNSTTMPITLRKEPELRADQITVMIVDDSPSVRHMTSKVIAGAGWVVKTAKDGIDALEQLKLAKSLPDIILSDIEMPRMDGYELVSTLKRTEGLSEIPVIMITSRAGEKHREKAFEVGVTGYLAKPYEEVDLLALVEQFGRANPNQFDDRHSS
ncbi:MAG: response regulator [Acidobacteriota bacterium]